MNCLTCDDVLLPEVSWVNIILFKAPTHLCAVCAQKFRTLQGKRCLQCSREYDGKVCGDCKEWNGLYDGDDPLSFNYSIYNYNGMMEETLARWKYRGDYQLGNIFKESFKVAFKARFPNECVVVPIPLSNERMCSRAFNQADMLATFLPAEKEYVLTRTNTEKQSKKTRIERLTSTNPFKIKRKIKKPVILVDDIYTTGTTLRHAAIILKSNGCPEVYAYTLIRA